MEHMIEQAIIGGLGVYAAFGVLVIVSWLIVKIRGWD